MRIISAFAVPVMIAGIVIFGLLAKDKVYDSFLAGAKEGALCTFNIIAPLVGLVTAISVFRASGAVEVVARFLSPLLKIIAMPAEVFPLALLRPVSGSASIAVVTDIFRNYGTDSEIGRIASVMMGSTETTFYTLAVYFGAINIKKTRHTLKSALTGDITGMIMSVLIVRFMLK